MTPSTTALKPNWVVPPIWTGETAFILACGPTLSNLTHYQLEAIQQHGRTIVINDAFYKLPSADVLYFCDKKWWDQEQESIASTFTGPYIVTINEHVHQAKRLRCTGEDGLDDDPACLRHGSGSGYQAIHLAYHLGAVRIVLLGYDLHVDGTRTRWKPRRTSATPEAQERAMRDVMLPKFDTLYEPLKWAGVAVVNATPNSSLKTWPYTPLEGILNGKHG